MCLFSSPKSHVSSDELPVLLNFLKGSGNIVKLVIEEVRLVQPIIFINRDFKLSTLKWQIRQVPFLGGQFKGFLSGAAQSRPSLVKEQIRILSRGSVSEKVRLLCCYCFPAFSEETGTAPPIRVSYGFGRMVPNIPFKAAHSKIPIIFILLNRLIGIFPTHGEEINKCCANSYSSEESDPKRNKIEQVEARQIQELSFRKIFFGNFDACLDRRPFWKPRELEAWRVITYGS